MSFTEDTLVIRVGTCSWTEKTLIKSGEFYPKEVRTAEGKLKYYAEHFSTVEVDSTYYAIPDKNNAHLWASRTPRDFIFHIKAYGALTGHGIDPRALPRDLVEAVPEKDRGRQHVYIKERSVLEVIARRFLDALSPLEQAGKLGLMVFQFPPWFTCTHRNLDYILTCKELMGSFPLAVEFRHGSWLTPGKRETVLKFLGEHRLTYVVVDEPQFGNLATVPLVPAVTTDTAYFRFHGRNGENWLKKNIETALRFAYHYSDDELGSFVPPLMEISKKATATHAMFNNCYGSFAVKSAMRFRELLEKKENEASKAL